MKATGEMLLGVKGTVEMFAHRWARSARGHMGFDDLCQVGYMAAMKAAESFEPERGFTFATYCRVPVNTAMRGAVAGWRGTMLSLDAPMGEGGSTYLEAVEAECASPEEAAVASEREALVRTLVDKAVAEFESHREMARLLVERLMDGELVEKRFHSGTSLTDIADKFNVSRQWVGIVEKKLRARLAEVLVEAA